MKQDTTNFRQFFEAVSAIAAMIFATAWIWHSLFVVSNKCTLDNSTSLMEMRAIIPAVSPTSIQRSNISKRTNPISSRRLESYFPAPFFSFNGQHIGCNTADAVFHTPALHPMFSPATFVRAGPKPDLSFFYNNKYFLLNQG